MFRKVTFLLCSLLAVAAISPVAAGATTYNVSTEADVGGTCLPESCTLRQAVITANGGSGGDVIKVAPGHYTLTLGELQLSKDVEIEGAGPAATVIDGNASSRVFVIPGTTVTVGLSGLAVENGRVLGATSVNAKGGGILNSGILTLDDVLVEGNEVGASDNTALIPAGGGIHNSGTLRVFDSVIEGNEATTLPHLGGIPQGGGFFNENGQVEITDSVISGNLALNKSGIPGGAGFGSSASTAHGAAVTLTRVLLEENETLGEGGIIDGGGGAVFRTDLTVRESTIRGNRAIGGAIAGGAGLEVNREGDFRLESSLVADNVVESSTFTNGAGIGLLGETTEVHRIVNSTITGNRGTSGTGNNGAGIFHAGGGIGGVRLDVVSSTISGNIVSGSEAEDKGANVWESGTEGSLTRLRDSIVAAGAGTAGFENCNGKGVESAGHNIDSLDQCNFHAFGDKVNTNPLLAALTDNGGPTATMAIGPESPAIDAGDADCPPTDQRGVARPQGGACDIGAFEFVPPPKSLLSVVPAPSGPATLRFLSAKVKVGLKGGNGKAGVSCLNVAGDLCTVSLRLLARAPSSGASSSKKARRTNVGTIEGTIEGGQTGKLKVTLKPKGLALLAAQPALKLKVAAKGKSSNRAGQPTAIEKKLTLKAKARKRAP